MQHNNNGDLDEYIWGHFLNFLMQPGNHEEGEDGFQLKDGVEFPIKDIPNPNPEQVPNDLWMEILMNHLEQNYN